MTNCVHRGVSICDIHLGYAPLFDGIHCFLNKERKKVIVFYLDMQCLFTATLTSG